MTTNKIGGYCKNQVKYDADLDGVMAMEIVSSRQIWNVFRIGLEVGNMKEEDAPGFLDEQVSGQRFRLVRWGQCRGKDQ